MKQILHMNDFDEIKVGSLILLKKACLIPTKISYFFDKKEKIIFDRYMMVVNLHRNFHAAKSAFEISEPVVAMHVLADETSIVTFSKIITSPHMQCSCNTFGYEVELFLI